MSVTNAETFKLKGGNVISNAANIVTYLTSIGVTATSSGGVVSFSTNSQLAGAGKQAQWEEIVRIAAENGGRLEYTAAT